MRQALSGVGIYLVFFAICAAAQTTVTNSNNGTNNTVPVYTGSATLGNSPISISGGNVGIGTTSPTTTLDVYTNTTQSFGGIDVRGSDGHSATIFPSLGAGYYNYIVQAGDQAIIYSNGSLGTGGFVIAPHVGGSTSGLRLDNNGRVGIGTTNPGATLEVDGNVKLTANSGAAITFQDGTTQSTAYTGVVCGGDYADAVDVRGEKKQYGPGDVLVLTADGNGDVAKSSEPYSTLVAGIYSTRPGTVGRRQMTDPKTATREIPMAMVGIVPAKVSAENGPIRRGDLLVTAKLMGYAMKGTDRSRMLGAVVGKAMGSLDSGTGIIEVLVTLQ